MILLASPSGNLQNLPNIFMTWQSFVSGMGASTLLWNVFTGYLLYGEANMVDPGGVALPTTKRQRNQRNKQKKQIHKHTGTQTKKGTI